MENIRINTWVMILAVITLMVAGYVYLTADKQIKEHDTYFLKYIKDKCPVGYMGLQTDTPSWLNLSQYNITK